MSVALRPLLRLTFAWNTILAAPAMIIVPLIGALTVGGGSSPLLMALRLLELGPAAVAVIAFAHLMVIDSEERTIELRFTYPPGRWTLVAERFTPAALTLLFGTVAGWAVLRTAAPELTLGTAIAAAMPPALVLTAAAFLAGCLSGNAWVAGAVPLAWWGLAYITSRAARLQPLTRLLAQFHLFQTCRPVAGVDYATNRWLLLLMAAVLLIFCSIRISTREDWLGRQ